jgi:hypothetical protein
MKGSYRIEIRKENNISWYTIGSGRKFICFVSTSKFNRWYFTIEAYYNQSGMVKHFDANRNKNGRVKQWINVLYLTNVFLSCLSESRINLLLHILPLSLCVHLKCVKFVFVVNVQFPPHSCFAYIWGFLLSEV